MSEPQWVRASSGNYQWNLVEMNAISPIRGGEYMHVVGSIRRVKNRCACRDWVVHYSEVLTTTGGRQYLGRLNDMNRAEASAAAKLLILAQRRNT